MSGEPEMRLVACDGSPSDDCPEDTECGHFYPHTRIDQCVGECPHVKGVRCRPTTDWRPEHSLHKQTKDLP